MDSAFLAENGYFTNFLEIVGTNALKHPSPGRVEGSEFGLCGRAGGVICLEQAPDHRIGEGIQIRLAFGQGGFVVKPSLRGTAAERRLRGSQWISMRLRPKTSKPTLISAALVSVAMP
jgi:hypothetical protein